METTSDPSPFFFVWRPSFADNLVGPPPSPRPGPWLLFVCSSSPGAGPTSALRPAGAQRRSSRATAPRDPCTPLSAGTRAEVGGRGRPAAPALTPEEFRRRRRARHRAQPLSQGTRHPWLPQHSATRSPRPPTRPGPAGPPRSTLPSWTPRRFDDPFGGPAPETGCYVHRPHVYSVARPTPAALRARLSAPTAARRDNRISISDSVPLTEEDLRPLSALSNVPFFPKKGAEDSLKWSRTETRGGTVRQKPFSCARRTFPK